jgi:hypothetical protein
MRYTIRLTQNGPRRQARQAIRRSTRRSVSFIVLASMMIAQATVLGGFALWLSWGWPTRVAFGVAAGFAGWAAVFLGMEAIAAMRTVKEISDARTAVHEHAGDDVTNGGMRFRSDDARWPDDELDDKSDAGLGDVIDDDQPAPGGASS